MIGNHDLRFNSLFEIVLLAQMFYWWHASPNGHNVRLQVRSRSLTRRYDPQRHVLKICYVIWIFFKTQSLKGFRPWYGAHFRNETDQIIVYHFVLKILAITNLILVSRRVFANIQITCASTPRFYTSNRVSHKCSTWESNQCAWRGDLYHSAFRAVQQLNFNSYFVMNHKLK